MPGRPELIGSLQLLYWLYYSNWTEVSKLLQSQLPYKDHPAMKHAIKVCPPRPLPLRCIFASASPVAACCYPPPPLSPRH